MEPFCIVTDSTRCISCHACVAHCKTKNAMPEGSFLSRLDSTGPYIKEGACVVESAFHTCYHCEKAWCMAVCPAHAVRRDDDGTVWIDAAACIGCGLCAKACPWHMPQIIKTSRRVAVKCDYCRDLRQQGLLPACVTACTAHALSFVQLSEAPQVFQEFYMQRMHAVTPQADGFVENLLAKRAVLMDGKAKSTE